jgi:poly(A) polymerase
MTRITADWVTSPASRAVMSALGAGYFVGGCVRNALLGAPVADIDIATPVEPEEVISRLEAAGLKAVPTGLKHGTVTAVHEGAPVEVTTFRADIATDGRHAEVTFTTDMAVDAGRRDFTMNALYADAAGEVIDPLGGLPDLNARRVRFIGRAEDRIREDYLRILRFFRFHAWYGANGIDADGLAACAELAEGLDGLARERIGWEFRKLLSASDPAPALASMTASGVLARCLPGAEPMALAPLVHLERAAGIAPEWQTRLSALGGEDVAGRLRLSRSEAEQQVATSSALASGAPMSEIAYRHGALAARAAALILAASTGSALCGDLQMQIAKGAEAQFPLKAKDFLALGLDPGPELGNALRAAEDRWIASGFSLDKKALLQDPPV